jgi:lipopolysaccharide biosynthesis protein
MLLNYLGKTMIGQVEATIERDVTFTPTPVRPLGWLHRTRLKYAFRNRGAMPPWTIQKRAFPASKWTLLFLYCPDGILDKVQRFLLAETRSLKRRLLVVCATPSPDLLPYEVRDHADALCWKGLDGYDFSGYTIGLREIVTSSVAAEVFVLNDSIYLSAEMTRPFLENPPWEFTGFSGSYAYEKHIQSFAFILKKMDASRLRQLRTVFPETYVYNESEHVIVNFETRLARIASYSMTVGSYWFGPKNDINPSLTQALKYFDQGFPFLKRSLLTKHAGWQNSHELQRRLEAIGAPTN